MRTIEQFSDILDQVVWWHKFHKKPVWLVVLEDGYALSVLKPSPSEIASGTVAILYDVGMVDIDKVVNTGGTL